MNSLVMVIRLSLIKEALDRAEKERQKFEKSSEKHGVESGESGTKGTVGRGIAGIGFSTLIWALIIIVLSAAVGGQIVLLIVFLFL